MRHPLISKPICWHVFLFLLISGIATHSHAAPKYSSVWKRLSAELTFTDQTQHEEVAEIADWYDKHSYYLDRVSKRAARYMHYILWRLEEKGMPADLALLPLVESAYDPFAYSSGKAAGLWQIVPQTAEHLELQNDWWYDGRRDVIDSTEAALDYLSDLNQRFDGDWLLTLAAYNSGARTVHRAMAKNRQQGLPVDFWSLELPAETQQYVPKWLAMVQIFNDPREFKLNLPDTPNIPQFVIVDTDGQIDLKQAADLANISLDKLYHLNPGFNRNLTPPRGPSRLLLPLESQSAFETGLENLSTPRVEWRRYKVASNDTLGGIAARNNISLKELKSINQLKGDLIRSGQTLLVPSRVELDYYAPEMLAGRHQVYKVKSGDTLSHIAQRFQVGVKDLKRWNSLGEKDFIRVGQKLTIKSPLAQNRTVKKMGYEVVSGDSLEKIAQRFRVKINDILTWNGLSKDKYLLPGQSLTLYISLTQAQDS
ncbi:LysM peptidoglycan-binding domain-containing protein [Spongiibacter sp. KMU-158]|uniref:LysM peptidoglycan-binding domain-containing protein n=1 Tax=Spongiibacter pelagi TaxID=2760804 RepID=A0A927GX80_9GAMM|nr:LysM peptidoglycan-binding domain-containing protein [Spongiibacter pelagi]MBD2859893.1 LysM peptidoglycan-binding domain-containing protein [Spongiibacter pelagi]